MANLRIIKAGILDGVIETTTIGYIEENSRASFESLHPFSEADFLAGDIYCYLIDTNTTEDGLSLISDLKNPEG